MSAGMILMKALIASMPRNELAERMLILPGRDEVPIIVSTLNLQEFLRLRRHIEEMLGMTEGNDFVLRAMDNQNGASYAGKHVDGIIVKSRQKAHRKIGIELSPSVRNRGEC